MATTSKGPTKFSFLRNLFEQNPNIKRKEADAAWQAAGHEGTIGESTFSNYKSEFKKRSAGAGDSGGAAAGRVKSQPSSKGTRGRTRPVGQPTVQANGKGAIPGPEARSKPAQAGDQGRVLDEVEEGIDDLIFRLKEVGGKSEVVQALRRARRILARSHEE